MTSSPPESRGREPRYVRSDLTLANAFTALRLLLTPIFGVRWAQGEDEVALWVFASAVATDIIDGFLARFLNQKSRLGALLDPIADKTLMLVALLVGIYRGAIPIWFAVVVISRDGIMLTALLFFSFRWRHRDDPSAWRPSRIGKYAMFLQSSSVALSIVDSTLQPAGLRPYVQAVMIAAAATTLTAGSQYVVRVLRAIFGGARAQREGG